MATPRSQKATERPISFVLHDTAAGAAPFTFDMVIRPSELTRTEPSRLAVHQVFGSDGGFIDSFGPGLGTIVLSGHTGWRGGAYDDGMALFQRLHLAVFKEWHAARDRAVKRSQDPSLVRLIFVDALDDFSWVCAPQQFVLRRNKAQPLLSQFQITLLKVSEDVSEADSSGLNGAGLPTSPAALLQQRAAGLTSLQQSVAQIRSFADSLNAGTSAALGTFRAPLAALTDMTQRTLISVSDVVGSVRSVSTTVSDGLLGVASELSRAAMNATLTAQQIANLPTQVRGDLQRATSAFRNSFCLIGNVFSRREFYEDYSPFYGGSNCSSTWQGNTLSPFAGPTSNGLEVLFPATGETVGFDSKRTASLRELARTDVVLNPRPPAWAEARMREVVA